MSTDRQYDFRQQRDGWQISVEAKNVLDAARQKRVHHEQRLEFWRAKEKESEELLRTQGIRFRATPRGGGQFYQYAVDRGAEARVGAARMSSNTQMKQEIHIDPEIEADLFEAQAKVEQHLGLVRSYLQWEKLLSLMPPTQHVILTIADVEFFDMGETAGFRIPEMELAAPE